MKKLRIIFVLFMILFVSSCQDNDETVVIEDNEIKYPKKELRGVWMATVWGIDWPKNEFDMQIQKQMYIDHLDMFLVNNINAVFVQIRPMADAFYPSSLEPWSQYITGTQGKNPGYDVLQFMIEETHKRGIEFHAWLNPYRISTDAPNFKPAENHIYKQHPEWTMTYNKFLLFRPALPEVRQFFLNVVDEIITKYNVDGIHLDDYFYPYPETGFALNDLDDYDKYGEGYETIEDFRRGNVNKMIESTFNLVKSRRPGALFSVSPYSVWRNINKDPNGSQTTSISNYDDLYADIRLWCEKGWVDFIIPQLYGATYNTVADFRILAEWWPKNSFGVPVMVGYPLYKFDSASAETGFNTVLELENEFYHADRQEGILGGVFYNTSSFVANKLDVLSTIAKRYPQPTVIPFMGRETVAEPTQVTSLAISGNTLAWVSSGSNIRYIVYHILENKAKVVSVTTANFIELEDKGDYTVSAVNIDNKEGKISDVITYK